mmetsp:Transcript_41163/g.57895  ORF Transcript_41163/g.57895 Transcript_41163/m.57895 type:complete len:104 (-) Transcript_41163:762-1073(-)
MQSKCRQLPSVLSPNSLFNRSKTSILFLQARFLSIILKISIHTELNTIITIPLPSIVILEVQKLLWRHSIFYLNALDADKVGEIPEVFRTPSHHGPLRGVSEW